MSLRSASASARVLLLFSLLLCAGAATASKNRVATDASGQPVHVSGSVVMIEPDIELSEVLAGGVQEPRREWSERARRLYPEEVHRRLQAGGVQALPDYDVPDTLPADTRLGQVLRLNEAVSMSILAYTSPGNQLATKPRHGLDWTLGRAPRNCARSPAPTTPCSPISATATPAAAARRCASPACCCWAATSAAAARSA
jgi:hypothetical protein